MDPILQTNSAGGLRKKLIKSMAKRALGKNGGLVGDDEMLEARQQAQGVAQAGLAAQQQNLNQAAMGAGAQNAGQFQKAAQQLGGASADAAVKAGGEANKLATALRERKRALAIQGVTALNESNRARVMQAAEMGAGAIAGAAGAPTDTVAGMVAKNALTRRK